MSKKNILLPKSKSQPMGLSIARSSVFEIRRLKARGIITQSTFMRTLFLTFPKQLLWRSIKRHFSFLSPAEAHSKHAFEKTEQSLISHFDSCATMRDLTSIHAQMIKSGFDQHVFVAARLVSFCCVSIHGSVDYAVSLFNSLKWRDGFMWNTMIRGFGRMNRAHEAVLFYQKMRGEKDPDSFTFCFLIRISIQLSEVGFGKQLHCSVLKHGSGFNNYVCNNLVHMYVMFKDIKAAQMVFDEMTERDLVSWNAIIDGYVNCGEYKEALRMFSRLMRDGFMPDEVTLVVALSACTELGALDFGRWIHFNIDNSPKLQKTVSIFNSLIHMYTKCGAIDTAIEVFNKMTNRSIVSWNTIILGLAMHGQATKALRVFNDLLENRLKEPDGITFLGALSACTHTGQVDEGRRYFELMGANYGLSPNIKHFGCMVDLLGKSGHLREAYNLIKTMPIECNAVVWRTLLGACMVHGDVELGEKVSWHLKKVEPDHSGDFVLCSHMYASVGRWNDVLEVRGQMKQMQVQKPEHGNSFTSVFAITNQ